MLLADSGLTEDIDSKPLNFEQIAKTEGIYKPVGLTKWDRLIVLKHLHLTYILFLNVRQQKLEPALPSFWSSHSFTKTNESLSMYVGGQS